MQGCALAPENYPLIVFVHVPKTAGTTVCNVLNEFSSRGCSHAQNLTNSEMLKAAQEADWLSAHIPRFHLAAKLTWLPIVTSMGTFSSRPVEYFAVVREPIAHLISHLNYSFFRQSLPDYMGKLDATEERLDAEVMSTDFSNAAAIKRLLFNNFRHFCECQSTYLIGEDFYSLSDVEIKDRLLSYTYMCDIYELDMLYQSFGFACTVASMQTIRANVGEYSYFNKEIFYSDVMSSFLKEKLRSEFRLYEIACTLKFPAGERSAFRPAFPFVTRENFDEVGYLLMNADVSNEVASGIFPSGRAHFDEFGFSENRRLAIFPEKD